MYKEKDTILSGRLSLLFYVFFTVGICLNAGYTYYYNWDIAAYTGAVFSIENSDNADVHAKTYEYLKSNIPGKKYEALFSNSYEKALAADPQLFAGRVKIAQTRPLFVLSVYLIAKTGISIISAFMLLSVLPVFLVLWLLYKNLRDYFNAKSCLLISISFAFIFDLRELAKLATPDALMSFFLFTSILVLLKGHNFYFFILSGFLAIISRNETIIFYGILAALFTGSKNYESISIKELLTAGIIFIFAFILTILPFGSHMNDKLMNLPFLGSISGGPVVAGETYKSKLIDVIRLVFTNPVFFAWCLPAVIYFVFLRKRFKGKSYEIIIINAILFYFVVRLIVFPNGELRFFIPYFLIMNYLLFFVFSKLLTSGEQPPP